jgi:hypothetical protein
MVEIMWARVNYKVMFIRIGSEKNNMILIFSAKSNNFRGESIFSNYFDHDQKLEIIIFRR